MGHVQAKIQLIVIINNICFAGKKYYKIALPLYPAIINNFFDHIWQKGYCLKYFFLVMKTDVKVERRSWWQSNSHINSNTCIFTHIPWKAKNLTLKTSSGNQAPKALLLVELFFPRVSVRMALWLYCLHSLAGQWYTLKHYSKNSTHHSASYYTRKDQRILDLDNTPHIHKHHADRYPSFHSLFIPLFKALIFYCVKELSLSKISSFH